MSDNDTDDNQSIDHTDPEVLERLYHDEGLSQAEIAERSEITRSGIGYHMDKHGIETRSVGGREGERLVTYATYSMEGSGYMAWYSRDPDKQRSMKVHRLVAIAEHGPDAVAGNHVHHKNEIPWDNRPENLEVKPPAEHHSHHSSGESHPRSKLTESDVKEILTRLENGESGRSLAGEYDVAETTISMIKHGNLWGHVGDRD